MLGLCPARRAGGFTILLLLCGVGLNTGGEGRRGPLPPPDTNLYRRWHMPRAIGKIWTEYHNGRRVRCNLLLWQDGEVDPGTNGTVNDSYEELRRLLDV